MEKLDLNGQLVGKNEPPYIIAEIGSNHNGDMDLCRKMIDSAYDCGANAVKFQSWSESSLISRAEYARNTSYADKERHFGSLEEMVRRYVFTPEQHVEILDYCMKKGITFLSSCFSQKEVDFLDSLDVCAFKLASMDINNIPLLEYISKKDRPVIVSTGMATLGEIEKAVHILQSGNCGPIALLHCIAIYPPDYKTINLHNIKMLEHTFDLPIGFSDHSIGTSIPIASIALGACIVEKHFTIDKSLDGWDHAISADPEELAIIVREGNNVFNSLGSTVRVVSTDELVKRKVFRRRMVAKHSMNKGNVITLDDMDFKRPGNGINPDEYKYVVGRTLNRDVETDEELEWTDFY
ncbi:polysaccharide biosynthesis protein [Methanocalculus taiwanensis]|uniref:Polysaccharide biosynthesis protein n=1 Tax=Methanocalculus taiwanensis TaxID=106207 RepID=A0ABD4TKV9_9EURY|nr:N-acetylneuraminate synthase family protein [Methanocalculus taiwanensis]MCQ1539548.1 polysaccharide biosynthesis protein [Methanocalculus taiwanensis]